MKIRWLRIVGIGPFAGEHTVDFSAFEDSVLFLLDGPTGAGKSTLIDAITFALYGDVARTKDASKDRLRSNHISDSDPSEADLVFEVATGIYRVTRTPPTPRRARSRSAIRSRRSLASWRIRTLRTGGARSSRSRRVHATWAPRFRQSWAWTRTSSCRRSCSRRASSPSSSTPRRMLASRSCATFSTRRSTWTSRRPSSMRPPRRSAASRSDASPRSVLSSACGRWMTP